MRCVSFLEKLSAIADACHVLLVTLRSMPRFRDRSCGFRSVCFIAVGVGYCGDLQLSVPTIRRCLPAKLVFSKKLYNLMIRVSMVR